MAEQPKTPVRPGAASNGSSNPTRNAAAIKAASSATSKTVSVKSSNASLEIGAKIEKDLEYLSKKKNIVAEDAIAELKRGAAREREEAEHKRQKLILYMLGVAIAAALLLIVLATVEKSRVEKQPGKAIGPTQANGSGGVAISPVANPPGREPGSAIVIGRPAHGAMFPGMSYTQPGAYPANQSFSVAPPQVQRPAAQMPPTVQAPAPTTQPAPAAQPVAPAGQNSAPPAAASPAANGAPAPPGNSAAPAAQPFAAPQAPAASQTAPPTVVYVNPQQPDQPQPQGSQ